MLRWTLFSQPLGTFTCPQRPTFHISGLVSFISYSWLVFCWGNFDSQNSRGYVLYVSSLSLPLCQFIINRCTKYSLGKLNFCRIFISVSATVDVTDILLFFFSFARHEFCLFVVFNFSVKKYAAYTLGYRRFYFFCITA